MPAFVAAALILVFTVSSSWAADADERTPALLLSPKILRRLKRDRERQTPRWINFENRVKSTPDSNQRGFELALYFAVTQDEAIGKLATAWQSSHPCEFRQVALIADWVGSSIPAATQKCNGKNRSELERLRDETFLAIASGATPKPSDFFVSAVKKLDFRDAAALYAAVEYLDPIRSATREDLRNRDVAYFADLPQFFLLSLTPKQLVSPSALLHFAALALVTLDPNLEGSQFLQSWAIDSSQTVEDGPGVAYELLWADPYLPGVSYRNMDTALYQEKDARLIARTSWDDDACRIEIQPGKITDENCPPQWQSTRMEFGRLSLIPMLERCIDISARPNNETTVLWKLKPGTELLFKEGGEEQSQHADAAGMWRVSTEFHGRVCLPK